MFQVHVLDHLPPLHQRHCAIITDVHECAFYRFFRWRQISRDSYFQNIMTPQERLRSAYVLVADGNLFWRKLH